MVAKFYLFRRKRRFVTVLLRLTTCIFLRPSVRITRFKISTPLPPITTHIFGTLKTRFRGPQGGEKTVPEPPGRPQNAPEALGTCPGSLKKPRAKNDEFSDKNQRRGGPKRVFWGPKWRKKTPESTKNREKVDRILEKRDLLKNATPPI